MAWHGAVSWWWLPIFSALMWLGMLLGMLLYWIVDTNREIYPSFESDQTIAYISDVGAYTLQPLFIAGSAITVVTFDICFLAERWFRHSGRLVPNRSAGEKALAILSIVFAVLGAAGIILLSIFDTADYPAVHDCMLLVFMGGYIISAIFICWEYQRLGVKNRDERILAVSFWIKLFFIIVEILLAAVFVGCMFTGHSDIAAIFEWIIAFVYTFYVLSFVVDLLPARHTRSMSMRWDKQARLAEKNSRLGRSSDDVEAAPGYDASQGVTATGPPPTHGQGPVIA